MLPVRGAAIRHLWVPGHSGGVSGYQGPVRFGSCLCPGFDSGAVWLQTSVLASLGHYL